MERLLALRGFTDPEQIQNFLYPKLAELKSPFLLKNMDRAVERMAEAFLKREKICIYADFDLDGTSGLALLSEGLKALGYEQLVRYQPKRLSEGYGFHASVVEDLKREGVSLIVTVDVGITALAAAAKAREVGVDVIITDHHLPGDALPDVLAIVNPNHGGDTSGLGYLSGAGVAYYFLRALMRTFADREDLPSPKVDLRALLDFFTIATLTDMVPLVDDNRILVKEGLKALSQTKRPGLRALIEKLNLPESLTSQDVAIRFAPKLNALSRMESGVLPIDLMLCEDQILARELVGRVMENNETRVQLQSEAEKLAMELLAGWTEPNFVFVASEKFHRGVIGLIATKLSQSFNRPAFVGSLQESDQMIVGSSRLPNGHEGSLVEALTSCAEHLTRFGGHAAAAGFELKASSVPAVVAQLSEYYREQSQIKEFEQLYDLELALAEVQTGFMNWYDVLGPFGAGFEVPVVRFNRLRIEEWKEVKGGHIKVKMSPTGGGAKAVSWDGMLFSPSARHKELLAANGDTYDVLGELQWNFFGGRKRIQVLIKDLRLNT